MTMSFFVYLQKYNVQLLYIKMFIEVLRFQSYKRYINITKAQFYIHKRIAKCINLLEMGSLNYFRLKI